MSDQNITRFIPNGLWIPLPVAAIKFLEKNHRPADRVLYALCLHLGKGLVAVFPSYPTVAKYSCVGQKSLRVNYDKLIALGFITIERKRVGKKFKNYYTILPKAWTFRSNEKVKNSGPKPDPTKRWMCGDCEKIVLIESMEFVRSQDWYGQNTDHWVHTNCDKWGGSRIIKPVPWWMMNESELEIFRHEMQGGSGNIS